MTDLFWPPAPVEEREPRQLQPPAVMPAKSVRRRSVVAAAGLSALVFRGLGVGVGVVLDHGGDTSAAALPATSLPSGSLSVVPTSYAGIAAKVLPSVVSINVATASG